MKIFYMGTAAYDAMPTPFCRCDTCLRSRAEGGKSIRTRSQALINDDLLIEFNPDTISHFFKYDTDWNKIKTCLITHSHCDHLFAEDICVTQYSENADHVDYYTGKSGYDKIRALFDENKRMYKHASINLVTPYKRFSAGGYEVLPLPANHAPDTTPLIYAIQKDGKRLLYAHDTGLPDSGVYDALKDFGKLDLVSLDCTGAIAKGWRNGHLCLETNKEVMDEMKARGIADENTIVVVNHFSHNGLGTHSEIEKAASKLGFVAAYDGMTVEF